MIRQLKNAMVLGLIALSLPVSAKTYTKYEIECLALNAYHEARGEGIKGMMAVIDVTLNRSDSKKYPRNLCDVVLQPYQFSWTLQGRPRVLERKMFSDAIYLAKLMTKGSYRGITYGSLWYHEKKIFPKWANNLKRSKVIGRHIFYTA